MDVIEYHECYFHLLSFEKNFRQFTQQKIGNGDLTLAHIMILSYLHTNGACGQKELTVTFNASSAAMAVSISRLEEKGYISKIADCEDKRNNIISLTEKGEDYLLMFMEHRGSCKAEEKPECEGEVFSREDLRHLARLQKKLFHQLKVVSDRSKSCLDSVE